MSDTVTHPKTISVDTMSIMVTMWQVEGKIIGIMLQSGKVVQDIFGETPLQLNGVYTLEVRIS